MVSLTTKFKGVPLIWGSN